jgi:CysZ protein
MARPSGLGFWQGASSVLEALRFILATPRTWPLSFVPLLVFVLLAGVSSGIAGSLFTAEALHNSRITSLLAPLGDWGPWVTGIATWLLAFLFGVLIALLLTPVLSAPAIERLVHLQETALGVEPREHASFVRQLLSGARAQLLPLLVGIPVLLGLSLVTFFVPPLALLTTGLKFAVTALSLAWNWFDYPLTLRGVPVKARLRLLARHWPTTLGFACGSALLLFIPCFTFFALPVGAVAATRVLARLEFHTRAPLPTVSV